MDVRAEKQLVKRVRELGLPTEPLFHAFRFRRIAKAPKEWMERKTTLRRMRGNSKFTDFIDKEKGYRLFGPSDIPGIDEVVSAAAEIYRKKRKNVDVSAAKKPFFYNIAHRTDFDDHPEILRLARSSPLIEAAGSYLGMMPTLESLGVYLSLANDSFEKSQMFHIDNEDLCQVKCFINVNDVNVSNGPFTFIPADRSRAIRRKLRHHWYSVRMEDHELEKVTGAQQESPIQLVGAPGHGAMVDTARCLHYGSRCRVGYRLVIMMEYVRFPLVSFRTEEHLFTDGQNGEPCRYSD